jgi:nucleoside-diphosphate-sugar epimerase
MKSLIIGRGLIGSYIHKKIPGSEIVSSFNALDRLNRFDYDWVINCTFEPALSDSDYKFDSCFDSSIIKCLIARARTKYLMLSSRKIYPAKDQWNASEESDICIDDIDSAYGRNKYLTEIYVDQVLGKDRSLILRLPNIFGCSPNQRLGSTFFDQMYKTLLDSKVISFDFNRYTKRDFMYAGDLAKTVQILMEKNIMGTYNCGYGQPVECVVLAEILIDVTGYGSIVDTDKIRDEFYLNTSKLEHRIVMPNFKHLKSGIVETIN